MNRIRPKPRSRIGPSAACASRNGARRLTASVRSKSSASTSSYPATVAVPWLGTTMSPRPSAPDASAINRAGAAGSARSAPNARATPPADPISVATRCAASTPDPYPTPTATPSSASRRQIAAPMPPLPPVTSATFPVSSVNDLDPGRPQLVHRPVAVARLDVDRAGRIPVHDHVEARALGVQRGRLDAVVERETCNVDGVHIALAQETLQLGALKPRVALEVARLALVDDQVDLPRVDRRVQRSARTLL